MMTDELKNGTMGTAEDVPESSIQTAKQVRTQEIIMEICADNPDAFAWIASIYNMAMTWDHIEDDDEIDKKMANDVFEYSMTGWGLNTFYLQNSAILSTVCANAISAWRSTNLRESPKIKALDIFTEIASTICFILHGMPGVSKWLPELRKLNSEICIEDDDKDGGKL